MLRESFFFKRENLRLTSILSSNLFEKFFQFSLVLWPPLLSCFSFLSKVVRLEYTYTVSRKTMGFLTFFEKEGKNVKKVKKVKRWRVYYEAFSRVFFLVRLFSFIIFVRLLRLTWPPKGTEIFWISGTTKFFLDVKEVLKSWKISRSRKQIVECMLGGLLVRAVFIFLCCRWPNARDWLWRMFWLLCGRFFEFLEV